MARIGKKASRIRDMSQPLKKAKKSPEKHIAKESWIVPIFSPRALVIAWHSFESLAESSVTLISSNQVISYDKIAFR